MMKFVLLKLNPLLETESYIQNEIVERNNYILFMCCNLLFDSFQKTWYHSKKEICVKNGGTALKSNANRESVLQKNQSYATEITDLTVEGNGVCHIQGMTVLFRILLRATKCV